MINAAIIGCGEMGKIHVACFEHIKNIKLHACCDVDVEKAIVLKEKYQAKYATKNVEKIYNDSDIDVVYILTTTSTHNELCLAALSAKKHIFIEKPVTLMSEETYQIYQTSKKLGLTVMVGFKFRFYEMIEKSRSFINDPFMVSVQVMDDPWPENFWANDITQGGGNVISQGVHGADLLRCCANAEPGSVYAVGGNFHQPTGVIDNISATFRFENSVAGSLVVGDCGQAPMISKFMLQMHGAPGSLIVYDRLTRLQFKPKNDDEILDFKGTENGFLEENKLFVKALMGEKLLTSTLWDGYIAQAMVDAALSSAKSGRVESISLKKR